MPTIQHELWPDWKSHEQESEQTKEFAWYYLHNLVEDTMLVICDGGCWEWIAHDTVHNTPHLYNNRRTAQLAASRLKRVTVKKYPWKR